MENTFYVLLVDDPNLPRCLPVLVSERSALGLGTDHLYCKTRTCTLLGRPVHQLNATI